jgi:hypothetical protein
MLSAPPRRKRIAVDSDDDGDEQRKRVAPDADPSPTGFADLSAELMAHILSYVTDAADRTAWACCSHYMSALRYGEMRSICIWPERFDAARHDAGALCFPAPRLEQCIVVCENPPQYSFKDMMYARGITKFRSMTTLEQRRAHCALFIVGKARHDLAWMSEQLPVLIGEVRLLGVPNTSFVTELVSQNRERPRDAHRASLALSQTCIRFDSDGDADDDKLVDEWWWTNCTDPAYIAPITKYNRDDQLTWHLERPEGAYEPIRMCMPPRQYAALARHIANPTDTTYGDLFYNHNVHRWHVVDVCADASLPAIVLQGRIAIRHKLELVSSSALSVVDSISRMGKKYDEYAAVVQQMHAIYGHIDAALCHVVPGRPPAPPPCAPRIINGRNPLAERETAIYEDLVRLEHAAARALTIVRNTGRTALCALLDPVRTLVSDARGYRAGTK